MGFTLNNVMLDVETLSTLDNAALVQIGAVAFDPWGNLDGQDSGVISSLEGSLRIQVDLRDPLLGVIDGDTVLWWLAKEERTRQQVLQSDDDRVPLRAALFQLSSWLRALGGDEDIIVWTSAPSFDFRVVRQACDRVGVPYPISRKKERCFKTLKKLFPNVAEPLRVGKHHDALDDAYHQAGWAIQILRSIPR